MQWVLFLISLMILNVTDWKRKNYKRLEEVTSYKKSGRYSSRDGQAGTVFWEEFSVNT